MRKIVYKFTVNDGITTTVKTFENLYSAFVYIAGETTRETRDAIHSAVDKYMSNSGGKAKLLSVIVNDKLGNVYTLWAEVERSKEYVR